MSCILCIDCGQPETQCECAKPEDSEVIDMTNMGIKQRRAENWLEENASMYRGTNASECILSAHESGTQEMIDSVKHELLPACTEALDAVSACLTTDGDRCAPNMEDFVKVANALTIIDDFYQMFNAGEEQETK